jgi:hypothetical protein
MDLLIAATAHAPGARLCTRNAADLVEIEHLIDVVAVEETGPSAHRRETRVHAHDLKLRGGTPHIV